MTYAFDPELAPLVPFLPTLTITDVAEARRGLAELIASMAADVATDGLEVDDRAVPGHDGAPDVDVRVYRPSAPAADGPRAAVLYLHGGGFLLGDLDSEHAGAVMLARQLDVVVVSVDYRLAPEHPFPAGLHDCYAGLVWLAAEAGELGVDPTRIAVCGQSAGGGLAAALALFARDQGGPSLCFQFLGLPELDDRLDTPSMSAFVDTPLWNRPNAELSWRYYLGEPRPDEVSVYAAPARATDLAGLPAAYVSVMEFDPLRDEGIRYAAGLLAAGVPVELHCFPGTFHGSALIADAAVSKRIVTEQLEALRRAFRPM